MKKSAWRKKIKEYNIKPNTSPKNRKRRERTGEGEGAAETTERRREKEQRKQQKEDEAREAERKLEERKRMNYDRNQKKKKPQEETVSVGSQEKKEALWKSPPANLTRGNRLEEPGKRKEVVISETDGSEREGSESDSEESAEEEQMKPGIIDIEKYEYQIGPQMRMKMHSQNKEIS